MTTTNSQKRIVVTGAGGFIGHHLVNKLKELGYWIRGVDLKYPEFHQTLADDFVIGDLRDPNVVEYVIDEKINEVLLWQQIWVVLGLYLQERMMLILYIILP